MVYNISSQISMKSLFFILSNWFIQNLSINFFWQRKFNLSMVWRYCRQKYVFYRIIWFFIRNFYFGVTGVCTDEFCRNWKCMKMMLVFLLPNTSKFWVSFCVFYWNYFDTMFFSSQNFWYFFCIDESEKLQEEYKKQPCHLERLYGQAIFIVLNLSI